MFQEYFSCRSLELWVWLIFFMLDIASSRSFQLPFSFPIFLYHHVIVCLFDLFCLHCIFLLFYSQYCRALKLSYWAEFMHNTAHWLQRIHTRGESIPIVFLTRNFKTIMYFSPCIALSPIAPYGNIETNRKMRILFSLIIPSLNCHGSKYKI